MKSLIVHLSDIHLKTDADVILGRVDAIAAAVGTLAYEIDSCSVLVTGDVAFSGLESQYGLAEIFLVAVAQKLQAKVESRGVSTPIQILVCPGNHDCDFSETGQARDIVTESVLKNPAQASDLSIAGICLGVQSAFWQFSASLPAAGVWHNRPGFDERIYRECVLSVGGESIRFVICNTALLSMKHERQGSLVACVDALLDDRTSDSLVVAAFHHPYNWLESNNARAFRKRIEKCSDLVLTGHEHDPVLRSQSSTSGAKNTYVEGGVLQDSDSQPLSSFNVLVVDTLAKQRKFCSFSWDSSQYVTSDADEWLGLELNKLREIRRFDFADSFQKRLEDPEITLSHPSAKDIRLTDLYVYPDMREITLPNERGRFIGGASVPAFIAESPAVLIVGDAQSGKTSLAKSLMLDSLGKGLVPVLVDCTKPVPGGAEQFRKYSEDRFVEQYDDADRETYRRLLPENRTLVVDNYDQLRLPKRQRARWLDSIRQFFGHVVLIAHEVVLDLQDMTNPESSLDLGRFAIQPLGHARRDRLVEKWLLLGEGAELDPVQFARRLTSITRDIDSLIGRNFVPAYPPYVLSVVQANEALSPIDTSASTHGYFYELFIRTCIARGRTSVQYDILMAYLAHLAYAQLRAGNQQLSIAEARTTHAQYEAKYEQRLAFDAMLESLREQRIVEIANDELRFKYSYVYYYFVASYLRDHIQDEEIRAHVRRLAESLHTEDSANIMLFLAHLSKDPLVIAEMLKAARALFPSVAPARLDEDVAFLDDIAQLSGDVVVYKDEDHRRAREKQLEALDHENSLVVDQGVRADDPTDPLVRIGMMLKTLQILGQIVKNFPGSLEGKVKAEIVSECYELGLRGLGDIMGRLKVERVGVLQLFTNMVKKLHPAYTDERVIKRAEETLVGLASWASLGVVKRIAVAVGSPHLVATYDRVTDLDNPAHRLIHISVYLDQVGNFPMAQVRELGPKFSAKAIAAWVLRSLCTDHFRVFPVDRATKQAACKALSITYQQLESSEPVKLLKAR